MRSTFNPTIALTAVRIGLAAGISFATTNPPPAAQASVAARNTSMGRDRLRALGFGDVSTRGAIAHFLGRSIESIAVCGSVFSYKKADYVKDALLIGALFAHVKPEEARSPLPPNLDKNLIPRGKKMHHFFRGLFQTIVENHGPGGALLALDTKSHRSVLNGER